MASEFIKITHHKVELGKVNFLQSQLSLLELTKTIQTYRNLRKREIALKIKLKEKIKALSTTLDNFDKQLPHTHMHFTEETPEGEVIDEKTLSLNQEIDDIRKKLESIQED